MGNQSKYRVDSTDLIDRIDRLKTRIRALENNPRNVASAIDHGSLIVPSTGQITMIKSDGTEGMVIAYYTDIGFSVTRMLPGGDDGLEVVLLAFDSNFDGIDQTFYQVIMYNTAGAFYNGGNLLSGETFVGIRHVNSGTPNGTFSLREWSIYGVTGNFYLDGKWLNEVQIANDDAIYSGSRSISAGVSSTTITYPATFVTTVAPVVGLHSASGAVDWALTAQSASSFTVAWIGTTAKIINMWNTRL